ncbi:MAG: oxygen-independent coproporphyrinogen III oxidase [Planctomycetota bacterium]
MISFNPGDENVVVPSGLFDRYSVPGPRYTSFPPVPDWGAGFSATDHAIALGRARKPLSIYVHVPFCRNRCLYCGCNVTISKDEARAERYLDSLERELDLVAEHLLGDLPAVQMHWGGGTPTFLTPAQVERLANAIRARFRLTGDAECGVEVDPRVTSREHLRVLRLSGFNRLSIGVQDFDPAVQHAVRRVNPPEMVRDLVEEARRLGFRSINMDLMYGLPHQTVESMAVTLSEVVAIRPDRVAMFGYAHLPQRFRHQRALRESAMLTGEDRAGLFAQAITRLTDSGWRFIGLDHFALPEDDLAQAHAAGALRRNFMGYTTHAETDLLAFGASAISELSSAYAQNHRSIPEWAAAVDAGSLATVGGHTLYAEDLVRREIIMELLCNSRCVRSRIERAHPDWFGSREFDVAFAPEIGRLADLLDDELVTDDGETITVTAMGRLFVRNIAMCFDPMRDQRCSGELQRTA